METGMREKRLQKQTKHGSGDEDGVSFLWSFCSQCSWVRSFFTYSPPPPSPSLQLSRLGERRRGAEGTQEGWRGGRERGSGSGRGGGQGGGGRGGSRGRGLAALQGQRGGSLLAEKAVMTDGGGEEQGFSAQARRRQARQQGPGLAGGGGEGGK